MGAVSAHPYVQASLISSPSADYPFPSQRNVVRVYGMCQELGNFSMVMEFLSGGSLDSLLSRLKDEGQELTPLNLFQIVYGIANGMAHLAAQKIVHRDLAARNILLDGDHNQPRISDFGFSRIVGDDGAGKTQSTVGPVRWMAPEVRKTPSRIWAFHGRLIIALPRLQNIQDRSYSEYSDVWSFAVILFEIVEKHEPYQGEDILSVAVSIRDQNRNPMDSMTAKPPSYVRKLMTMCFEPQPSKRPTFAQILEYLQPHAPSGFAPPQLNVAAPADASGGSGQPRSNGKSKKKLQEKPPSDSESDESSSSSSSEEDVAEPAASFAPKQTTTRPTRWSQAVPKDRDTLMQTYREDSEAIEPPNVATVGYRDVQELHAEENSPDT